MRDQFQHSAEGTHWQKKNHKYIRKEGNRYIYPSDLKKVNNSAPTKSTLYGPKLKRSFTLHTGSGEFQGTQVRSGNGYKEKWSQPKGNFMERTTIYSDNANGNKARRTPKDRKMFGEDVFGTKSSFHDRVNHPNPAAIRPSKRQTISNYKKISEQHAQETKAKAHAKASNMPANEARLFSQQRTNRKHAANGVADHYRMDDGTYFQPHEKSNYQFAKYNNSKAAINKMHRAKAANGVGAKNQEYAMQKSAEHQRKQALIKEEANRQKRNIASYRQGNTGNVSDLTKLGVNRAKRKAAAGSGQQTDYRSVSANHAGKEHVNRQANVDYKQYVNRPETVQRKAEKQIAEDQKRIKRTAAKNLLRKGELFGQSLIFPGIVHPTSNTSKQDEKEYQKAEEKARKKAEKATKKALEKSKKKKD